MYICTLHLTRNEILALTFAHNWIQRREEYKLFDHYTSISQYCQKKRIADNYVSVCEDVQIISIHRLIDENKSLPIVHVKIKLSIVNR